MISQKWSVAPQTIAHPFRNAPNSSFQEPFAYFTLKFFVFALLKRFL